jgi:hypothetical protein
VVIKLVILHSPALPKSSKQVGFRVGGRLSKQTVFFFNYEKETQPKTIQTTIASSICRIRQCPEYARPSADSLRLISAYLKDTYGYVTGPGIITPQY